MLALFASAPALAREPRPAIASMQLGPAVAAPMGYIEFCQREASDCPTAPGVAAFDKSYWTLAFQQAERSAFAHQKPASMRRFMRTFRSRQRAPLPADTLQTPASAKAVVLSRRVWDEIERVNNDVNNDIIATPDRLLYKVDDFWSLPASTRFGRRHGDCEDYVLQKRHELLSRGYPQEALSIALVRTRWDEHHAVLIVETTSGAFVLDSLSSWILPWSQVDYRWIMRQSPLDPAVWVEVGPQSIVAGKAPA